MVTGALTATEKRLVVVKKYEEILGRNKYSQPKRSYAYKKYSDGKYYSDCSSSIALAYKYAGYPFYDNNGSYNPNTVGMYQAKSLVDVPVVIKNGIIQNPEVLRPGDMLLFAGSDNSRKYADCVGHVEMVAKISGTKVTLYGHGSGTPRATEMNAYCKKRYSQKTKTVIGHKGLLKVRRFFVDDGEDGKFLCRGCEGGEVKKLQENLIKLGYAMPRYGADGSFGAETEAAVIAFQKKYGIEATGVVNDATVKKIEEALTGYSQPKVEDEVKLSTSEIMTNPGTWNLRTGPGANYAIAEVVKGGSILTKVDTGEWIPVEDESGKNVLWIGPSAIKK